MSEKPALSGMEMMFMKLLGIDAEELKAQLSGIMAFAQKLPQLEQGLNGALTYFRIRADQMAVLLHGDDVPGTLATVPGKDAPMTYQRTPAWASEIIACMGDISSRLEALENAARDGNSGRLDGNRDGSGNEHSERAIPNA